MATETDFTEPPIMQKRIIRMSNNLNRPVITATQMLESMTHNPLPTRAEASDVANAIYDRTSAIMLSGESAAGKYPVEAVTNMAQIAEFTEKNIDYTQWFYHNKYQTRNNIDAISHATCAMAIDVDAKAIVVASISGQTARMVSRFRCPVDIVGMTTSKRAWRKLNLSWGVTPVLSEEFESIDVMFHYALHHAKEVFNLSKGDNVVLTGGKISGKSGNTNTIRVESI
jgi:pyruvate kinase